MASPDEPLPSQQTADARTAFLDALKTIGSSTTTSLETRVADIHTSSDAISAQEASLSKQTDLLAKQTEEFQKLADESRGKLKEIGDVQNWAEIIERDLLVLEETMRIVDEEAAKDGEGGKKKGRRWF